MKGNNSLDLKHWNLFNDEPEKIYTHKPEQIDQVDLTRSLKLSMRICKQLREAQHRVASKEYTKNSEMWEFARFGLFAGLGQGKTTVVLNIIDELRNNSNFGNESTNSNNVKRSKSYNAGETKWNIIEFDAALYEAEKLEFSFNHFIHSWLLFSTILKQVAFLLPVWIGLIFISILATNYPEIKLISTIQYLIITIIALLSAPPIFKKVFKLLKHQTQSSMLDGLISMSFQEYWRTIGRLLGSTFAFRPTLIVIDNLDRASVKQQRGVLRSIYKNQNILRFHLLIAMDETPLKASLPDPEEPNELLQKIIQAEFRLAAKIDELTAFQVVGLCRKFFEKNENNNRLSQLFFTLPFISEFTQIISHFPNSSPRMIKRMINDLSVSLDEFDENVTDVDLACLAKINAIYYFEEKYRFNTEDLLNILDCHKFIELEAFLTAQNVSNTLSKFLLATLNIQPSLRGLNWRRLLGVINCSEAAYQTPDFSIANKLAIAVSMIPFINFIELGEIVETMAASHGKKGTETLPTYKSAQRNALLLLLFSVKKKKLSIIERLNFYRCMWEIVDFKDSCNQFALLKLWMSDYQVNDIMLHSEYKQVIDSVRNNTNSLHYLLSYMHKGTINKILYEDIMVTYPGILGRDYQRVRDFFNSSSMPTENIGNQRLHSEQMLYARLISPAIQVNNKQSEWKKEIFIQIKHLNEFGHNKLPEKLTDALLVHGAWYRLLNDEQTSLLRALLNMESNNEIRIELLEDLLKALSFKDVSDYVSIALINRQPTEFINIECVFLLFVTCMRVYEPEKVQELSRRVKWFSLIDKPFSDKACNVLFSKANSNFWANLDIQLLRILFSETQLNVQSKIKKIKIMNFCSSEAGKYARIDPKKMANLHAISEYFEDAIYQ